MSRAIRKGALGKGGAYFSIPGGSTYYDLKNPNATPYNLALLRIADTTHQRTALQILQTALKDKSNTSRDIVRLKDLIKFNQENGGFLDYMEYDEIPSISRAAKTLGYDGLAVVENDYLPGDASSINVWNLEKIRTP